MLSSLDSVCVPHGGYFCALRAKPDDVGLQVLGQLPVDNRHAARQRCDDDFTEETYICRLPSRGFQARLLPSDIATGNVHSR